MKEEADGGYSDREASADVVLNDELFRMQAFKPVA